MAYHRKIMLNLVVKPVFFAESFDQYKKIMNRDNSYGLYISLNGRSYLVKGRDKCKLIMSLMPHYEGNMDLNVGITSRDADMLIELLFAFPSSNIKSVVDKWLSEINFFSDYSEELV